MSDWIRRLSLFRLTHSGLENSLNPWIPPCSCGHQELKYVSTKDRTPRPSDPVRMYSAAQPVDHQVLPLSSGRSRTDNNLQGYPAQVLSSVA